MGHPNANLFLAIAAGPHPPPAVMDLAFILAIWAVPAAVLLFIGLWVRGDRRDRAGLMAATFAMLIGLGLNAVIGLAYVHPRPFMVGLGGNFLHHAPDSSFPSDHATFLWSLGFALIALGTQRGWGWVLAVLGLGVAWARVYLGAHFPFDMAGSLVVALVVAAIARLLFPPTERWLLPPCQGLYGRTVAFCRLPPALFPRERPGQTPDRAGPPVQRTR